MMSLPSKYTLNQISHHFQGQPGPLSIPTGITVIVSSLVSFFLPLFP